MHEMSIAQSMIEIIREEMEKSNSNVLKSVRLRIGKMSVIVPDSLSFCFGLITEGTDFEGAELLIDIVPLVGLCNDCKMKFEIEDYVFECPYCNSTSIKTVSGRELEITEIVAD
jgi:hydrogenase nickel incorporation protein HypA/HybF